MDISRIYSRALTFTDSVADLTPRLKSGLAVGKGSEVGGVRGMTLSIQCFGGEVASGVTILLVL